jgi:hypothetical protein
VRGFHAIAFALVIASLSFAQTPEHLARRDFPVYSRAPEPILLPDGVQLILRSSGQVFAGTVISVQHNASSQGALATTTVRFHVDEAIRGVRKNQVLEIREWAGLWQSGEKYCAGERVLLFLYPPSKLGLTSPVGGSRGRFPVDDGGGVLLPARPGRSRMPVQIRGLAAALRAAERE